MTKRGSFFMFLLLGAVFSTLQYRLWYGPGSFPAGYAMTVRIEIQQDENLQLEERNRLLYADILELKSGMETVEERARHELGMIKPGETLFVLPNKGPDL